MMITQPHCVCVDRKKIELYFYLRHKDSMIKYILKRLARSSSERTLNGQRKPWELPLSGFLLFQF